MPYDLANPSGPTPGGPQNGRRVAVIGAGVSGLTAAWLLSKSQRVTLYEADSRLGGHANTVDVPVEDGRTVPVDAGFIVFNRKNYPNFTALMGHLGVDIHDACMSFGASMDDGGVEYSGQTIQSLFANPASIVSVKHWAMLKDIVRFHRHGNAALAKGVDDRRALGDFVAEHGFSAAFVERFLEPFAAAIWSTPSQRILDYPAASFLKFFQNHGLLQVLNMPIWNTVVGGSRRYVEKLAADMTATVRLNAPVARIERDASGVTVIEASGERERFDDVVLATHADMALKLLAAPSAVERDILGAFSYQPNHAVVHTDPTMMPRRRSAWSSWNYMGGEGDVAVTYWMNRLQDLPCTTDVFVTLNPNREIAADKIAAEFNYAHPMFDLGAGAAQKRLWTLQGFDNTWYCGAHFGQGFHEDGMQAGLAVAEALGGLRRPWKVDDESARIYLAPAGLMAAE